MEISKKWRNPLFRQAEKRSACFAGASFLEAPPGIEPGMKVLQTSALPLGYGAGL